MKTYIYILSILIIGIISCQEPNKSIPDNNVLTPKQKAPERIISKDIPKMRINTSQGEESIKIFGDATALKAQQEFLQKDDHIGNLRILVGRESIGSDTKGVPLNKLNASLLDNKVNRSKISSFKRSIKSNDSGDKYILLNNNSYSLDIDPESGSYENLKITSKEIGVVTPKGIALRVGDKTNILKKYFPKEFEDLRRIKLREGDVNSTRILLTEFIGKKSDVYLYVHHKDGIITEIGTWEQY